MDEQYVKDLGKKLSNWGRWGADDQRGTLNYITPEVVKAASRLVKRGRIVRLGLNYDEKGPCTGEFGRFNPIHRMSFSPGDFAIGAMSFPAGAGSADDMIIMPLQCATQWDGLSHVYYDGQLYNGYDMGQVSGAGAKKNSIDQICEGIISRGVFLDIPRFKGKELLDPSYAITPDNLDQCAANERVSIRSGDVLLVRTGQIQKLVKNTDREGYNRKSPGLSFHCLPWLHEKQVAAVACDNTGVEVNPPEIRKMAFPFHMVAIRDMGLTLGEIFDFEALSADCARDGVYEFMFCGAPLPFTGAVGSPLNPLAVK